MGKKSKRKTKATATPQNHSNGSGSGSSNRTGAASSSTQSGATAVASAAAGEEEELMEPIAEFDYDVWEARFPFAAKTSDPHALELDKGHELFLDAIQIAKTGNLLLAGEYVASAFLRDLGDGALVFEKEKGMPVETFALISCVAKAQRAPPPSLGILTLIKIAKGWSGQQDVLDALKYLNDMLDLTQDMLKKTPTLGQRGDLTQAKLYYLRGRLFHFMCNGKSCLKDWTKALALDPSLAGARLARLHHWTITKMKTHAELHAECVKFLGLVHEDYRELDIIYDILASTIWADPRLGTYADAMEYYKKSLQATSRRAELYGPRFVPHAIISKVRNEMKMAYEDPGIGDAKERKELDTSMAIAPSIVGDYLDQKHSVDKTMRNRCLNCKKDEGSDGIQLSKCSRCRRVYYCSEECIRANWKEHKVFCNEISGHKQQQKKAAAPVPR